jgi:capsular polysaccharide biosynthesis protein
MPVSRLSIAHCNTSRTVIEESVPFVTGTQFEIGTYLQEIDNHHRFVPEQRTALVECFTLENVVFDGLTGTLFKNGIPIHESRYSTYPSYHFSVDPGRVTRHSDKRPMFIGFHRWHNNYYHWLIQCIPSMYWGRKVCNEAEMLLALPALNSWQEQALSLAGMSKLERCTIESQRQYEVGRVMYTTFTQGPTAFQPSRKALEVFRLMRSQFASNSTPLHSIIYVSREDTPVRRMVNEAELVAMLKAEGVDIVVPSRYSVEQQIAIFASAKAIIGPHGAGLTNIIFCQPGATLYEIMMPRKLNPCYANLAHSVGMKYWAEAFRCDSGFSIEERKDEWAVDVQEVVKTVRRLMAIPPTNRG